MKMILILSLATIMFVAVTMCVSAVKPQNTTLLLSEPGNFGNLGDTHISASDPDANNANSSTLHIKNQLFGVNDLYTYLMFDLTNLTQYTDYNITSASLRLRYVNNGSFAHDLRAFHVYNGTWNESLITYNNHPCKDFQSGFLPENLGVCNTTPIPSSSTPASDGHAFFNMITAVKTEKNQGDNNVSFLIGRVSFDSGEAVVYSKDSGTIDSNITILPLLNITITSANQLPIVENISISPVPASEGVQLRGHGFFNDTDGDNATGNFTYWYINGSVITEANNSFFLNSPNVSSSAQIIFSMRFNDTYGVGQWYNSSQLVVDDTTPPVFIGNRTGSDSVVVGNKVTLYVNVTDLGDIANVIAEVQNPNQQKSNLSMSLDSGNLTNGGWIVQYTTSIVGSHSVVFYASDGSSNTANTGSELTFSATALPSTTSGGGGGGGDTIIVTGNNSASLFFGLTTVSFTIISTPTESVKVIKFKNLGNAPFTDGKVSVIGPAKSYIEAFVCDEPSTGCASESVSVASGENKFLRLVGNFDDTLGLGSEGIIRIQEQRSDGKTADLLLSIDRPPFYKYVIAPISNSEWYQEVVGQNEFPALIIGYVGVMIGLFLIIMLLRGALL